MIEIMGYNESSQGDVGDPELTPDPRPLIFRNTLWQSLGAVGDF